MYEASIPRLWGPVILSRVMETGHKKFRELTIVTKHTPPSCVEQGAMLSNPCRAIRESAPNGGSCTTGVKDVTRSILANKMRGDTRMVAMADSYCYKAD